MFDRRLLDLAPKAMRYILQTVGWKWLGLLANIMLVIGIVMVLAPVIEGVNVPILPVIVAFAVALVVRVLSARKASAASFKASEDVKRNLRERIFGKLLHLGPAYTRQVATAEVVQVSVEGTEQLETYFGSFLPQLFYALLAPLTLFAIIAPMCLKAAVVLLVFVPLIPVVIAAVQNIAKRTLGAYWDEYTTLGDSFLENLQGLTTLKIYQADAARHKRMNEEAEHFRVVTMKVLRMQLNSIIVMDVVALGGAAAGIAVALFALRDGTIDLAQFLAIALLSADFFVPMRQLGSFFHVAMNGMAASKKIFAILDLPEPAPRTLQAKAGGTLAMHDVTFAYEQDRPVLHNVSLQIPAHGMVGIVGGSGCGKSTIAMLLAGGDASYQGSVTLGGDEVRDIDSASLARTITNVRVGSYLFRGSVRDNLLMAKPDATDAQMWDVLEAASLADFMRTQAGLDTRLDGEAANLSGGQRQRLALARALLHDCPIYIFDEATSNIDVESEEAIMSVVSRLAQDHAVIVISHRLANVTGADKIYALEHGKIAGVGTHDELLAGCEVYCKLWDQQRKLETIREQGMATMAAKIAKTSNTDVAMKEDEAR